MSPRTFFWVSTPAPHLSNPITTKTMRHFINLNMSCHKCEHVMSSIQTSHATRVSEPSLANRCEFGRFYFVPFHYFRRNCILQDEWCARVAFWVERDLYQRGKRPVYATPLFVTRDLYEIGKRPVYATPLFVTRDLYECGKRLVFKRKETCIGKETCIRNVSSEKRRVIKRKETCI